MSYVSLNITWLPNTIRKGWYSVQSEDSPRQKTSTEMFRGTRKFENILITGLFGVFVKSDLGNIWWQVWENLFCNLIVVFLTKTRLIIFLIFKSCWIIAQYNILITFECLAQLVIVVYVFLDTVYSYIFIYILLIYKSYLVFALPIPHIIYEALFRHNIGDTIPWIGNFVTNHVLPPLDAFLHASPPSCQLTAINNTLNEKTYYITCLKY